MKIKKIASSFSIQTCKSAYLYNHEYSLKLTFLQNRSIKNPETNHIWDKNHGYCKLYNNNQNSLKHVR